jgi:hypothetical protein
MPNEQAFAALTLVVAACEQALVELDGLDPRPALLVERLVATRDEAANVARSLGSTASAGAEP